MAEDDKTRARKTTGLKTVYLVLTPGGRVLGDRHHESAEEAAKALAAAAVGGVIVPGQVPEK